MALRKNILLSGFAVCFATALLSCGESTALSSIQNDKKEKVSSIQELGECDANVKGEAIYVEDMQSYYFCDGRSWKIIESDSLDVDGEKSSSSVMGKSSSSKKVVYDNEEESETDSGTSASKKGKSSSSTTPISDVENLEGSSSSKVVKEFSSSSELHVESSSETPIESSSENRVESSSAMSSSSEQSANVTKVDEIAYDFDHAASCNATNTGYVVYIQSEGQGYICTKSGYVPVNVSIPYDVASSNSIKQPSSSDPAWLLNAGALVLLIYPSGIVMDSEGHIVGIFKLDESGTIIGVDGTIILEGIDVSTLPITSLEELNSSSSESKSSSSEILDSSSSEEESSSSEEESSSSENTESSSSESGSSLATTGNIEEDVKKYPVPTLKNILGNGTTGWNTRYWDACKPHCSWISNGQEGKTDTTTQASYEAGMTTARNCNIHDIEVPTFTLGHAVQKYWMGYEGTTSACEVGAAGVFTCTDMAPIAVNDTLSYAYVAGPGSSITCGKCFHLQYDGSFKDVSSTNAPKETHKALKGKHIIVMASNIGHDVANGQFDLMVPGGGPGIFNALNIQVNGQNIEWGAQYGGFIT